MRKLATLERIESIRPIDGADRIEVARIRGWDVVVKKGEFEPGDRCVYFEIDSLLPREPEYSFLSSFWNEQAGGYRLKTIRLKGQVSQGLALPPISVHKPVTSESIGEDLTEYLGVSLYTPPVPIQLAGDAKSFTWPVPKTDEERIQNLGSDFFHAMKGRSIVETLKLDGTSATYGYVDGEFHACSRNFSLRENENNLYWQIAHKYKLPDVLGIYMVQGEICGPGIQKNRMALESPEFFVFNVYRMTGDRPQRLGYEEMARWVQESGLRAVPVVAIHEFSWSSVDELLEYVTGLAYRPWFPLSKSPAEGIVVRTEDYSASFKVISNRYLLKGD